MYSRTFIPLAWKTNMVPQVIVSEPLTCDVPVVSHQSHTCRLAGATGLKVLWLTRHDEMEHVCLVSWGLAVMTLLLAHSPVGARVRAPSRSCRRTVHFWDTFLGHQLRGPSAQPGRCAVDTHTMSLCLLCAPVYWSLCVCVCVLLSCSLLAATVRMSQAELSTLLKVWSSLWYQGLPFSELDGNIRCS